MRTVPETHTTVRRRLFTLGVCEAALSCRYSSFVCRELYQPAECGFWYGRKQALELLTVSTLRGSPHCSLAMVVTPGGWRMFRRLSLLVCFLHNSSEQTAAQGLAAVVLCAWSIRLELTGVAEREVRRTRTR